MKTYLKNIIGAVALGLALLANSVPTWAGYASSSEVVIWDNGASGAVQTTRYSSDDTQYIQCDRNRFRNLAGGFREIVECHVRNKFGVKHWCSSDDPKVIAVANAITDHSYIYFTWHPNHRNRCYYLGINNASYHLR